MSLITINQSKSAVELTGDGAQAVMYVWFGAAVLAIGLMVVALYKNVTTIPPSKMFVLGGFLVVTAILWITFAGSFKDDTGNFRVYMTDDYRFLLWATALVGLFILTDGIFKKSEWLKGEWNYAPSWIVMGYVLAATATLITFGLQEHTQTKPDSETDLSGNNV